MNRIKKEDYKYALISYLASLALLYFGLELPLTVVFVPMVLIFAIARCGFWMGGAAAVLAFATFSPFFPKEMLILAVVFLPVCLIAAYAIRAKKRFLHSVIYSGAAMIAGILLAMGMLIWLTGKQPVDFIVDYTSGNLQFLDDGQISSIYYTIRYPDIVSGAVTQEAVLSTSSADAIAKIQDILRETLNMILVASMAVFSMMAGLLYYIVPRAFAKKQKIDVAPIPAFSEFALPRRFWLAYLISYFGAAIGASLGWQSFDVLETTVDYAYSFAFVVQALSFIDFMYRRSNVKTGIRVALHILATVVFSGILVWIGLFENAAGLRRLIREREV